MSRTVKDWDALRRQSKNWKQHVQSGSLGGNDFPFDEGTPIKACFHATVSLHPNNGTGGNTVRTTHASGYALEDMHCQRFVAHSGEAVNCGAVIALVGYTGAATGSHDHKHGLTPAGVRIPYRTALKHIKAWEKKHAKDFN